MNRRRETSFSQRRDPKERPPRKNAVCGQSLVSADEHEQMTAHPELGNVPFPLDVYCLD